jgi:hypothetical protein
MSTLNRLLEKFASDDAFAEKTAGDATPPAAPAVTDPSARMLETVRQVSKTAAAASVSTSAGAIPALDKIAADLVASDDAALQSKMASAGVIFADTVMARFAQYEAQVGSKVAAAAPDAIKQAYEKGREDLEKEAAAAYAEGQESALREIHKVATELHLAGQQSAINVLDALAKAV